jgi:hypothetical protein
MRRAELTSRETGSTAGRGLAAPPRALVVAGESRRGMADGVGGSRDITWNGKKRRWTRAS